MERPDQRHRTWRKETSGALEDEKSSRYNVERLRELLADPNTSRGSFAFRWHVAESAVLYFHNSHKRANAHERRRKYTGGTQGRPAAAAPLRKRQKK
jgi:hypothetical protein